MPLRNRARHRLTKNVSSSAVAVIWAGRAGLDLSRTRCMSVYCRAATVGVDRWCLGRGDAKRAQWDAEFCGEATQENGRDRCALILNPRQAGRREPRHMCEAGAGELPCLTHRPDRCSDVVAAHAKLQEYKKIKLIPPAEINWLARCDSENAAFDGVPTGFVDLLVITNTCWGQSCP